MANELREHHVEVVALSVDEIETQTTSGESKMFLDKIQFPFRSGIATPQLLEILQLVNNAVYKDDHRPLPVPVSFLIDGNGRLAAIYKGPVSVDLLLRHVKSLTLSAEKRAIASLPFPGRWLGKPGPHALTKLNARLWDYGFEEIAAEFASGLPETKYRTEKAKLLLANAIRFRERGDTGGAKQQLDRLLELDPHNPGALLEIGTNLARQGDLAAAVEELAAAVAGFEPPSADAHMNLGAALRRLNRPQEAMQHLRRALELDPDFAEAHASVGLLLASTGEYKKAAESFGRATRLNPTDSENRINLAVALMQMDKLNDALGQLRRAVRIQPDSAVAHTYLSEVLGRLGRFDEARLELKSALALEPNATKLWFRLGELSEQQGDIATALDSFQRILELAPNQPTIATRVAWILATVPDDSLRNGAEAVRLAEKAAKATQRKTPPVLDVLAAAYAEGNRFDEAIATAEEALNLLRENSESTSPLIGQIGKRLEGYRMNRKFRNQIRRN
jgi:tetratricopeptide (TPR) repeat protein